MMNTFMKQTWVLFTYLHYFDFNSFWNNFAVLIVM